jgi:phage shock protein PspC (stress-responsive transcriptional regulator)
MVNSAAMADPDGMDEQTVTIDSPPLPPPAPPAGPIGRWYQRPVSRDPDDNVVGGVIAGLSKTYGFDVRTTRIAVAIATIVLPIIIVAYGVAWMLLPARPEEAVSFEEIVRDRRRVPLYIAIGIVLIAGGVGSFGSWFFFGGFPWGVGLIAVGVLLWAAPGLARSTSDRAGSRPSATVTSPATVAPDYVAPEFTAPESGSAVAGLTDTTVMPTVPSTASQPAIEPVRARRRRQPVGSIVTLAVLVLIAIASAGDALDWWDIAALSVVIIALVATAVGVLVSAIVNRSWIGIPLIALLTVVTTGLLITRPDLDGGIGRRTFAPQTVELAERPQQLAVGELTVDLTEVDFGRLGDALHVRAEVGVGQLRVIVPAEATVVIDAELGGGNLRIAGEDVADGVRHHDRRTLEPAGASSGTIVLDVEVGAGQIDIDRAGP